jgi:hypothetical protein
MSNYECWGCGASVDARRWEIGKRTCMACGEAEAVKARLGWCVAPMHKSNYILITNRDDLTGLNNKGGLVR